MAISSLSHGKSLFFALSLVAGLVATSQSAFSQSGFSTGFNNYPNGDSLSGTNEWDTNDNANGIDPNAGSNGAYVGQSDYVGTVVGYSNPSSNYFGKLGGGVSFQGDPVLPGLQTIYLFHNFTLESGKGLSFNVDFSISSSVAANTKDTFGWSFRIGNTEYAALLFTPQSQDIYDGPEAKVDSIDAKLGISLRRNNGMPTANTPNAIIYDSLYHLTVNIDPSGTLTALIDGGGVGLTNVNVANGSFAPAQINNVAAMWDLRDKSITPGPNKAQTGAGENAIIFDNYTAAIPEPSTVGLSILAGVGGAVALLRRRKLS